MAESANSGAGSNIESPGFKFAFDNVNFSDRILKLELMAEPCTKGLGPFFDNRFSIVAFGGYLLHCLCRGEVADDDDEVADDDVSTWSKDCSTVLRVKKLHINSAILALKSPFFHKELND
ncbi:hypothetical protein AMTR_s00116p00129170 [Amborella trichopoda]|uniref:BTB domain-containing protein n=1 Tax=Amborella trichopoda TaxID=13333 RepID=W1NPY9_AMBTC|nr:hypothetical protein AMTR_s00116p00129170 [Amborella trichopoda]